MKLLKGKKYELSWDDITTSNDWQTIEEILQEAEALKPTVNIWTYLCTYKNWKILSSGKNSDGQYFDVIYIPKKVIIKARRLK